MGKPNLILHIGAPKTGTSFIQQVLKNNSNALNACGYHYFENLRWHDGSHHHFAFSLMGLNYGNVSFDSYEQNCDKLVSEMKLNPNSTYILSSELLFFDANKYKGSLELFFSNFSQVTVVVYLRNPVDYLTSLYKQMVRDPNDMLSLSPEEFAKSRINILSYKTIVDSYRDLAAKVNVIDYDKSKDIIEDIFSGFSCPKLEYSTSKRVNTSIEGASLKLKIEINKICRDFEENKKYNALIEDFIRSGAVTTKKVSIFEQNMVNEILENIKDHNNESYKYDKMCSRFLPLSEEIKLRFISYLKERSFKVEAEFLSSNWIVS